MAAKGRDAEHTHYKQNKHTLFRRKLHRVTLSFRINKPPSCLSHVNKKAKGNIVCIRNVPPLLSNPHIPFNMQYRAIAIYINSESELQKY